VVVAAPDDTIAAFAGVWLDPRNRVGHFEPVGTHADFRRRGLARVAMTEGRRRMQAQEMVTATLDHDAENVAASALYTGVGFAKKYELYGFRRLAT
jgi:ribosomal protein S18 acetylase RimI-like enzyme